MKTAKLAVDDMMCVGCAGRVRTVLMNTTGVVKVITSLDDHTAEVTFDDKTTSSEKLIVALRTAGFLSPEKKCC
jgi:copper chaperone CopZ